MLGSERSLNKLRELEEAKNSQQENITRTEWLLQKSDGFFIATGWGTSLEVALPNSKPNREIPG